MTVSLVTIITIGAIRNTLELFSRLNLLITTLLIKFTEIMHVYFFPLEPLLNAFISIFFCVNIGNIVVVNMGARKIP